jgi:hypothetical protein
MSRALKLVVAGVALVAVLATIRPSTAQAHWGFGHYVVRRPVVGVHVGYYPSVGWHRPHYVYYGAHFRWHRPHPVRVYHAPPVYVGFYAPYACY